MSTKNFYYPRTILSIITAHINQFADIKIRKYDKTGIIIDTISVPIVFGDISKLEADNVEGPGSEYFDLSGRMIGTRYYEQIPRMSLTLDGITYDSSRTTAANEYRNFYSNTLSASNNVFTDYQNTPYTINTSLHITSRSLDQFAQIIEQIAPYFNPAQVLRLKELEFLPEVERTLPVILTGISIDQSGDMNSTDVKYINGSLSFSIPAFLYRKFDITGIIKTINTNIYSYDTSAAISTITTSASNQ